MERLAAQIKRNLETQIQEIRHCALHEDDLQRLWPIDEENRKAKIEQFAVRYGFKLSYYRHGLCAIFEKDSTHKSQ